MSTVYITSDLHLGHRNICKYRTQFESPQKHDEYIIEQWNSVVKRNKYIVWVLGDMCINNKYYDFSKLISCLNGTIYVITGNHCWLPAYDNNKIKVMNGITKRYGFWLTHCPMHPNELRGKKNVHGHIHGVENKLNDDMYLNVNCEFWDYKPLDLDFIKSIL